MQYLALLFLLPSLAAAALKTICNKTPYGSLELSQCVPLEISFADARDGTLRIFDEEQLAMEEPGRSWPGIRNPFKTSVVQIPRIWTRGMSKRTSKKPSSDLIPWT